MGMSKAEEHTLGRGFTDGGCWVNEKGEALSESLPDANEMRRGWDDEDGIPYIVLADDGGPMYVLSILDDASVQGWCFEDRSCVLLFEGGWDTGRMFTPPEIESLLRCAKEKS